MARVMVKCVPDDDPNADGFWLNRRVPAWVLANPIDVARVTDKALRLRVGYGGGRFDLLTRHCAPAGHHVVKYRGTGKDRLTYRGLGAMAHAVTLAARTFRALAPKVERAAEAIRVEGDGPGRLLGGGAPGDGATRESPGRRPDARPLPVPVRLKHWFP